VRFASGAPAWAGLALAFAISPAGAATPRYLAPSGDSAGVIWRAYSPTGLAGRLREVCSVCAFTDTISAWRRLCASGSAPESYRRQLMRLELAHGDTLAADSMAATLLPPGTARPGATGGARSIWEWDAIQVRVLAALKRGDAALADSLLERSSREAWPDIERASWSDLKIRTRAALGDTAGAMTIARQVIRTWPVLPPARSSLARLETMLAARGDSLDAADAAAAVEVDALRAARLAAATRARYLVNLTPPAERYRPALRLAQLLREARRLADARAAAASAESLASTPSERARARIERARGWRDSGRSDSAYVWYGRAARLADTAQQEIAYWEWAREAEDAGDWKRALPRFIQAARLQGSRAEDAEFGAGLMYYLKGSPDSARVWWKRAGGEAATFWWGVSMRASARSQSRAIRRRQMLQQADSALSRLASMPGYAFYRVAARDTLGRRSPRAEVTAAACGWDAHRGAELRRCAPVAEALDLIDAGGEETGIAILQRWLSNDARFGEDASLRSTASLDWLVGSGVAYRAGRLSIATSWADRAYRTAAPAADSTLLSIVPWSYPPAYDALVAAVADSSGIEPALLWATMRQESRFDPQVRSGSNAVGLMQLLLPAAQDAARWGREPKPSDETPLEDPATNLRWGVRYLAHLINRFDGHAAVALSAYNAGPSTVPPFWRELIDKGGEALFCEIASNADAQDYARRILAYRQAYRDLAPRVAR